MDEYNAAYNMSNFYSSGVSAQNNSCMAAIGWIRPRETEMVFCEMFCDHWRSLGNLKIEHFSFANLGDQSVKC